MAEVGPMSPLLHWCVSRVQVVLLCARLTVRIIPVHFEITLSFGWLVGGPRLRLMSFIMDNSVMLKLVDDVEVFVGVGRREYFQCFEI